MQMLHYGLFAAGFYPLYFAWRSARGTSLFHAIHWGIVAWLGWGLVLAHVPLGHPDPAIITALALTGCAGVAVLGARRPHVGAWDFVVLGLLAVMLLPLAEMAVLGARTLGALRITFLVATLGIGIVNYLPTRFGPAAFVLGLGCAGELISVLAPEPLPSGNEAHLVRLCWLAAPWLAFMRFPAAENEGEMDRTWRSFRDRWGLVWGQRVREQFNRAAANAGWGMTLTWSGFSYQQTTDAAIRSDARTALTAVLRRFDEVDELKK